MGEYVFLVFCLIMIYLLLHYHEVPAIINSLGANVSASIATLQGRA